MHVRRVRFAGQAICDPRVDSLIKGRHFIAQVAEIDCITYRRAVFVKAQTERGWATMWLVDGTHPRASEAKPVPELPRLGNRPIEIGLGEHISEPQFQLIQYHSARVQRHRSAD